MSIVTILIAGVVAFIVWKFVTGIIKFLLIGAIVIVAILFATGSIAL